MRFDVTEVSGTDWHVQAVIPNLTLKEGAEYVLKFQIRGWDVAAVTVNAMIDQDDWHTIGLTEQVALKRDFEAHTFTFKAEGVAAGKNRISFILGSDKGQVWIKGLTLTEK